MISIAYQTEFTNSKRLLSIYANAGYNACVRVTNTDTWHAVKEVYDVGIEDGLVLYADLVRHYAKCEDCEKPCSINTRH